MPFIAYRVRANKGAVAMRNRLQFNGHVPFALQFIEPPMIAFPVVFAEDSATTPLAAVILPLIVKSPVLALKTAGETKAFKVELVN